MSSKSSHLVFFCTLMLLYNIHNKLKQKKRIDENACFACVCVRKCVLFSRYFSDYAVITVTAFSVIRTQVTKTLKPVFTIPERKKKKKKRIQTSVFM